MRPRTLLLLIVFLLACGDREEPGQTTPNRAPDADSAPPAGTGPFAIEIGASATPGSRPPVRFTGDTAGVTVTIWRATDPRALFLSLDDLRTPDPTSIAAAEEAGDFTVAARFDLTGAPATSWRPVAATPAS